MSIEELKKDAEEFAKLLSEATRQRVKDAIIAAKADVDKEIVTLEMKARLAAERKAAGAEGVQKRYLAELHEFAWDQSDKFIKIFVTVNGVQNKDESSVNANFAQNSMKLLIVDMNGKDYALTINNLLYPIDVEKSYRKIKTDMVAIYMKKQNEGQHWDHLTTIEKRLKQKQDEQYKPNPDNPEDALVNIMKKMYNTGDTKTKQMIAKAWTEGQQKIHEKNVSDI